MAVNGTLSGASTGTTNFTAYVNPYTVINNGNQLNKTNVKDMISYPLKGKVNHDSDSNGNQVSTGKGNVTNNSSYTNNELSKGKVK